MKAVERHLDRLDDRLAPGAQVERYFGEHSSHASAA